MTSISIAVNRTVKGKLPAGDPRWERFTRTFVTERPDVDELAALIQSGYATAAVHRKRRADGNFVSAQHLSLDFDDGQRTLDELAADPFIARHAALIHTTSSHTPAAPRLRVIFTLDRAIPDAAKYEELIKATLWRYGDADPACKDVCRLMFGAVGCEVRKLGNVLTLETAAAELIEPYRQHLAAVKAATVQRPRGDVIQAPSDKLQAAVIARMVETVRNAPDGAGHDTLIKQARLAGGYIATGSLDEATVYTALVNAYMSRPTSTPRDEWHAEKTTADGIAYGKSAPLHFEQPARPVSLNAHQTSTTVTLSPGQYLAELDLDLPRHTLLQAQTGSGKTTWATGLDSRVILVLPTQAKIEQLAAEHPDADVFYQHGQTVDETSRLILTTPESFGRLLGKIADPSEWSLVVDESHLISQAGYRRRGLDNVIRTFDGAWARVILMTGTPLPLVTPGLKIFEAVAVEQAQRAQPATRVIWQRKETAVNQDGIEVERRRGDLAATVGAMMATNRNRRHLVYANDKGKIADRIHHEAEQAGYDAAQIYRVNADLRDGPAYRSIVNHEVVPPDCRVLIATSVIETGINLHDDAAEWMIHFVTPVSSIEAQQLVSRFRDGAAEVRWYNAGKGDRAGGDYLATAEAIYKTAGSIAAQLNALDGDQGDDPLMEEARRQMLLNAARLRTAQLVERETVEGEAGRWQPSPVGVNNAAFEIFKTYENTAPDYFKANTAGYGWAWSEDVELIVKPSARDIAERRAYVTMRDEERTKYIGKIADKLRGGKPEDVREQLRARSAQNDNDWRALAKIALGIYEINGAERGRDVAWVRAVNGAEHSRGKTRRANDIRRRVEIQADRDRNPLTQWFYDIFEKGDRLTPADMVAVIGRKFEEDPYLAVFVTGKVHGLGDVLSERKAVLIMRDYFQLKRCKIATGTGDRFNGYEITDDAGAVAGVDVREFMAPVEDVSLKDPVIHTPISETPTQTPTPAAEFYLPPVNPAQERRELRRQRAGLVV